jgi:hypothetical protein
MTTTTSTSTAIAITEPVFSNAERLALAGFLAGYTGLTREAYARVTGLWLSPARPSRS